MRTRRTLDDVLGVVRRYPPTRTLLSDDELEQLTAADAQTPRDPSTHNGSRWRFAMGVMLVALVVTIGMLIGGDTGTSIRPATEQRGREVVNRERRSHVVTSQQRDDGAGARSAPVEPASASSERTTVAARPLRIDGHATPTPTATPARMVYLGEPELVAPAEPDSVLPILAQLELTPEELRRLGVTYVPGRSVSFVSVEFDTGRSDSHVSYFRRTLGPWPNTNERLRAEELGEVPTVAPLLYWQWRTGRSGPGGGTTNDMLNSPLVPEQFRRVDMWSSDAWPRLMGLVVSNQGTNAEFLALMRRTVRLSLDVREPADTTLRSHVVDLWYLPTPAFLSSLPERYSGPLTEDLALLDQLENGLATFEDACRAIAGRKTLLKLCGSPSGAISSLSASRPTGSDSLWVTIGLSEPRTITFSVHDRSGNVISNRGAWRMDAGEHRVGLGVTRLGSGVFLLAARSDRRELVTAGFSSAMVTPKKAVPTSPPTLPSSIPAAPSLALDSAALAALGISVAGRDVTFRTAEFGQRRGSDERPEPQYALYTVSSGGTQSTRGGGVSTAPLPCSPVFATASARIEGVVEAGTVVGGANSVEVDSMARLAKVPAPDGRGRLPDVLVSRLARVRVRLNDAPWGATSSEDSTEVTLWFAPTASFLRVVPERARVIIAEELRAAAGGACAHSALFPGVLGTCSARTLDLTTDTDAANDEITVRLRLREPRSVSIGLYDSWGGFVAPLATLNDQVGEQSVRANLARFDRGHYQIVAVTNEGERATVQYLLQPLPRRDIGREIQEQRAAAARRAADLGLTLPVEAARTLELTPAELASLGVTWQGDSLQVITLERLGRIAKAGVRAGYRELGYDPHDTNTIVFRRVTANPGGAESEILPRSAGVVPPFTPVLLQSRATTEQAGRTMTRETSIYYPKSPAIDSSAALALAAELALDARSSATQAAESARWTRRLIPLTVRLQQGSSLPEPERSVVKLWYVATPEFVAHLPERYRTPLLLELAALKRLETEDVSADEVCRSLPGEATYLDLCRSESGAVTSAALNPNPASGTTVCSFTLADKRELVIALHDMSGRFLRVLSSDEYGKGSHSVMLQLDGVEAGAYLVAVRTTQKEQVVMRAIVR